VKDIKQFISGLTFARGRNQPYNLNIVVLNTINQPIYNKIATRSHMSSTAIERGVM
jgi:hypothetical protein